MQASPSSGIGLFLIPAIHVHTSFQGWLEVLPVADMHKDFNILNLFCQRSRGKLPLSLSILLHNLPRHVIFCIFMQFFKVKKNHLLHLFLKI